MINLQFTIATHWKSKWIIEYFHRHFLVDSILPRSKGLQLVEGEVQHPEAAMTC